MNALFRFLIGQVRVTVRTPFAQRRLCALLEEATDAVYDAAVLDDDRFSFYCLSYRQKRVLSSKALQDATTVEEKRFGLPYAALALWKRKGHALGAALFALLVWIQTLVVWDIRISGNDLVTDAEIRRELRRVGFREGTLLAETDISDVQDRFLLSDSRISWIGINLSGTVAFVEVEERTQKPEPQNAASDAGIVAGSDCVIERLDVLEGTALVGAGDTVTKGTVVISPVMTDKSGADYFTGASGKVLARTEETFCVMVPFSHAAPVYTGQRQISTVVSFLGLEFSLPHFAFSHGERGTAAIKTGTVKLFHTVRLPIRIAKTEKQTYAVSQITLSPEDARRRAYEKLYEIIAETLGEAEILSTEFSESPGKEVFVLRCRTECIRDVAKAVDTSCTNEKIS